MIITPTTTAADSTLKVRKEGITNMNSGTTNKPRLIGLPMIVLSIGKGPSRIGVRYTSAK
jgi:hypothetical protein